MEKESVETTVSHGSENNVVQPDTLARKPFIEPEIHTPVDVLEATTFFVSATSGAA